RLAQINRVGPDDEMREDVAVADEVLDRRGLLAVGHAVPPNPFLLDVRGVDGQDVAVPFTRRKSLPRVRRPFSRMLTAVQPDRPLLLVRVEILVKRDQLLRPQIAFLGEAELDRAVKNVRADVNLALMLTKRQARGIPGVGREARAFVQREPGVVAELRTG